MTQLERESEMVPEAATKMDIGAIAPLHEVEFSPWIRRLAFALLLMFIVFPAVAVFAPWQQNLPGVGQVAAFTPQDRPQAVEAPIEGRVKEVYVIENQIVEKGDPLVKLEDIDPLRIDLLNAQILSLNTQKVTFEEQAKTYADQVVTYQDVLKRTKEALEAKIRAAEQKITEMQQKVAKAEVTRDVEQSRLDRMEMLPPDNVAEFSLFKTRGDLAKALADVAAQTASLETSRADFATAQAELGKGTAEVETKIQETLTKQQGAEAKVADICVKLEELNGKLRKQQQQLVTAPRSGQVQRVRAFTDGTIVKKSQVLLQIVPEVSRQAVELYVRGVDAPLIEVGRKVRLQFEGWPAIQFVGWPAVAVGTFGGVVAQVDAADSGGGRFRVLIAPDPDDIEWPKDRWLRQGVRAKGWVLLNEVPLWFEIWRQLNGFPPAIAEPEGVGTNKIKGSKNPDGGK